MARYVFLKDDVVKAVLDATPEFVLNSKFESSCEMQILGDTIPKLGDMRVGAGYITPQRIKE